ncbi:MAG: hypothetical protein EBR86_03675 [Planctomycetia bacterium]|nr:hypothetical protein [Planctomycetia bacterium]
MPGPDAGADDLEVVFGAEGPRYAAGRLVLPHPPRSLNAPDAERLRGQADGLALRLAHHDDAAHARARPDGPQARDLFDAARRALGDRPIIAEDLGLITPDVESLRQELGLPGMRVLQFIFGDPPDPDAPPTDDDPPDRVVYTGTHDNDTACGWYRAPPDATPTRSVEEVERERHRLRVRLSTDGAEIHWDLIGMALASRAHTAIYPLQDLLGLGSEARMNVPGRPWGNWAWRFHWEQLTPEIEARLATLTMAAARG